MAELTETEKNKLAIVPQALVNFRPSRELVSDQNK